MKHTAVKGIACSMVNSPLIFSYIPMVWVPRALSSSRTQDPEPWGRQETAPGRTGFYFPTCFMNVWMLRPPDETLMILISQPLTCFVETLLRNTFVYTFVLGCRDDLFFCPYCVSYYISYSLLLVKFVIRSLRWEPHLKRLFAHPLSFM